jgi:hypothetical protein
LKFNSQYNIVNKFNNIFITSSYFDVWLSGFLEIKGYFNINIRKNGSYDFSFSIEHNNDYYILYNLYRLYNMKVIIKNINDISYLLMIYKKDSLNKIISHCISYPLQGEKSLLMRQFIEVYYK